MFHWDCVHVSNLAGREVAASCAASQNHALRRQHHGHALRLVDVPAAVLDEARKVRRLIARLDQRAVDAVRLLVQLDACGRIVLLVACRLSGVRVFIAQHDVALGDRAVLLPQLGGGVAGLFPRAARSMQAWTKSAGTVALGWSKPSTQTPQRGKICQAQRSVARIRGGHAGVALGLRQACAGFGREHRNPFRGIHING